MRRPGRATRTRDVLRERWDGDGARARTDAVARKGKGKREGASESEWEPSAVAERKARSDSAWGWGPRRTTRSGAPRASDTCRQDPNFCKAFRIAVIPGDGIGREVTAEAVKVIEAVGKKFGRTFELEQLPWSADHYLQTGITIPPERLRQVAGVRRDFHRRARRSASAGQSPCAGHSARHAVRARSVRELSSGQASARAAVSAQGPWATDVNFVVFRENTEGVYVGIGGRFKAGTDQEIAIQEEINTYRGVHRIIKYAFDYAKDPRAVEGLHGGQEQRDDPRTRPVAACVSRGRRGIPVDRVDALLHRRARDVYGARSGTIPGHRDQQPVRRHHY